MYALYFFNFSIWLMKSNTKMNMTLMQFLTNMIMIAYLVAFECEIEVEQMRKINRKIVKILSLLTVLARNILLIKHFGFSLGDNR
jgi:hypothetical protein